MVALAQRGRGHEQFGRLVGASTSRSCEALLTAATDASAAHPCGPVNAARRRTERVHTSVVGRILPPIDRRLLAAPPSIDCSRPPTICRLLLTASCCRLPRLACSRPLAIALLLPTTLSAYSWPPTPDPLLLPPTTACLVSPTCYCPPSTDRLPLATSSQPPHGRQRLTAYYWPPSGGGHGRTRRAPWRSRRAQRVASTTVRSEATSLGDNGALLSAEVGRTCAPSPHDQLHPKSM